VGSVIWRLVLLARPRGALLVCALPLLGYGYSLWEQGSTVSVVEVAPTLLHMAGVWLLGHMGAMWLNAELDRDEGAVLLGRSVTVPRGTGILAYCALALSILAALPLGWIASACVAGCAVMAILYSHPRIALKGHPIFGPLINGAGYATLSPVAGWAIATPTWNWRVPITLAGGVLGVLGLYFAAQAFQRDEDGRRGYRTLVVTHGPQVTLQVARVCIAISMGVLLFGSIAGIYPRALLIAALPCFLVDRWMARWSRVPGGGDGRWASGMVVRLMVALTLVLIGAYTHHFTQMAWDLPVGGLGTAITP
jgi:4-hydroxybenzoate polyprenyltransferase